MKFTTKLQNDSTARIKRNQTARLSACWPVIAFTTFSETSGISSSMDTQSIWMVTQCKALQHRESESEKKKRHTNIVFIHVSLTLLFFVFCVSTYDVTIHICYSHFAPGWQTHQTRAVSSCHCASKCKKNTAKNGYCVINCTDSESIQTEVFTGGWRLKASAVHWGFLFTRHTQLTHKNPMFAQNLMPKPGKSTKMTMWHKILYSKNTRLCWVVQSRKNHLILFCVAKSFLSSSVVSGQKTLLYRRVMMYFSTWSITCSTDSEEPGEQRHIRAYKILLVLPSSGFSDCLRWECLNDCFKYLR